MRDSQDLRARSRRVRLAALKGAPVTSDLLGHAGSPYPVTSQQVKDLAWGARFVEISCHLAERGLGDLEETDPTVIARSVEHALYLFDDSVVEAESSPGKGLIRWEWPEPEFVNALEAVVEVSAEPQAGRRAPPVRLRHSKTVFRSPGESRGELPFTLNDYSDSRVRVSVAMAVRSPATGEVYQSVHCERVTVHVPGLPEPEQKLDHRDLRASSPTKREPSLVLGELDDDSTKQQTLMGWIRRCFTRQTILVLVATVAVVAFLVVVVF